MSRSRRHNASHDSPDPGIEGLQPTNRRILLVVCCTPGDDGAVRSHRPALGRTRPSWYVVGLGCLALVAGCTRGPGLQRANVAHHIVVHGNATLDGLPFDARWIGAVVLDGGLSLRAKRRCGRSRTAASRSPFLPTPSRSGCGAPGARIVLWTFAPSGIVYSTNSLAWPRSGSANFAAHYSTAKPAGAAPTTAEFTGAAFRRDGRQLPPGTRVEAYIGATRCGVASVRRANSYSTEYILAVVGPDSIPGCTRGAMLTFRINGRPTASTSVVNTPPGQQDSLDLYVP